MRERTAFDGIVTALGVLLLAGGLLRGLLPASSGCGPALSPQNKTGVGLEASFLNALCADASSSAATAAIFLIVAGGLLLTVGVFMLATSRPVAVSAP